MHKFFGPSLDDISQSFIWEITLSYKRALILTLIHFKSLVRFKISLRRSKCAQLGYFEYILNGL